MTTLQIPGKRIRLFGGWYQQDKIYNVDSGKPEYIGFVQSVRKNKQTTYTTHKNGAAVIGINFRWLLQD